MDTLQMQRKSEHQEYNGGRAAVFDAFRSTGAARMPPRGFSHFFGQCEGLVLGVCASTWSDWLKVGALCHPSQWTSEFKEALLDCLRS